MVNVFVNTGGVSSYIVTDRTLGSNFAIAVTNGVINITATGSAASSEPIVEDTIDTGTNYKIFVDNGIIGWEVTGTVQDDSVILSDTGDSTSRKLIVSNGILGTTVVSGTSETFSFDDNDVRVGTTDFSSIDGITTSGISDGFIRIRGLNKMGQPVNQEISVASSVPVRFYVKQGIIQMKKQGQELIENRKMMAEPDLDLQNEDLIYVVSGIAGLTRGVVNYVKKVWDFAGVTHHTECTVMDI